MKIMAIVSVVFFTLAIVGYVSYNERGLASVFTDNPKHFCMTKLHVNNTDSLEVCADTMGNLKFEFWFLIAAGISVIIMVFSLDFHFNRQERKGR